MTFIPLMVVPCLTQMVTHSVSWVDYHGSHFGSFIDSVTLYFNLMRFILVTLMLLFCLTFMAVMRSWSRWSFKWVALLWYLTLMVVSVGSPITLEVDSPCWLSLRHHCGGWLSWLKLCPYSWLSWFCFVWISRLSKLALLMVLDLTLTALRFHFILLTLE